MSDRPICRHPVIKQLPNVSVPSLSRSMLLQCALTYGEEEEGYEVQSLVTLAIRGDNLCGQAQVC